MKHPYEHEKLHNLVNTCVNGKCNPDDKSKKNVDNNKDTVSDYIQIPLTYPKPDKKP